MEAAVKTLPPPGLRELGRDPPQPAPPLAGRRALHRGIRRGEPGRRPGLAPPPAPWEARRALPLANSARAPLRLVDTAILDLHRASGSRPARRGLRLCSLLPRSPAPPPPACASPLPRALREPSLLGTGVVIPILPVQSRARRKCSQSPNK